MLGAITNNNYQTLALSVRSMPDSKSKDEMVQKANTLLDKVIEQYAPCRGFGTGNRNISHYMIRCCWTLLPITNTVTKTLMRGCKNI